MCKMVTTLSGQNNQALGSWAEGDEGGKKLKVAPRVSCNALPSSETGTHIYTPTHTYAPSLNRQREGENLSREAQIAPEGWD